MEATPTQDTAETGSEAPTSIATGSEAPTSVATGTEAPSTTTTTADGTPTDAPAGSDPMTLVRLCILQWALGV